MFRNVVLPAPLAPIRPATVRRSNERWMSTAAVTAAKFLLTPWATSIPLTQASSVTQHARGSAPITADYNGRRGQEPRARGPCPLALPHPARIQSGVRPGPILGFQLVAPDRAPAQSAPSMAKFDVQSRAHNVDLVVTEHVIEGIDPQIFETDRHAFAQSALDAHTVNEA